MCTNQRNGLKALKAPPLRAASSLPAPPSTPLSGSSPPAPRPQSAPALALLAATPSTPPQAACAAGSQTPPPCSAATQVLHNPNVLPFGRLGRQPQSTHNSSSKTRIWGRGEGAPRRTVGVRACTGGVRAHPSQRAARQQQRSPAPRHLLFMARRRRRRGCSRRWEWAAGRMRPIGRGTRRQSCRIRRLGIPTTHPKIRQGDQEGQAQIGT